jgi:hypothetical protein
MGSLMRTYWTERCLAIFLALYYSSGHGEEMPRVIPDQMPRAEVKAFVDEVAIPEFLRRVQKFSKDYGYELTSRDIRPDGLHSIAKLERKDMMILVLNPFDSVSPAEFRMTIYDTKGHTNSGDEVMAAVDSFKSAVCESAGVKCK